MTDDALIAAIRDYKQADEHGIMVLVSRQACDEAAARIAALTHKLNEPINGTYSINQLVERVAQAEIERDEANDKVRQLRIIANVNGDWNLKYGEAVDRATKAEAALAELRRHARSCDIDAAEAALAAKDGP